MAGIKGRGGRPRLSAEEHLLRGTYRRDRHGDLPSGTPKILRMPIAPTVPLAAAPLAIPGDLSPVAQAKWAELTQSCPWLQVEHADALRIYVTLWSDWTDARSKIAQFGTLIKGPGGRAVPSPFVGLATDAMRGLLAMQSGMLFGPKTREGKTVKTEQTRLEKFLAAKRGR